MGAYFNFFSEEDLNQFLDTIHFSNCEKLECGGICEISMEPVHISISGKTIDFEELPLLKCKKCGHLYMTVYSASMISCVYEELKNRSDPGVFCKRSQYQVRYHYCEELDFDYDSRDYRSIPGLWTQFSNDGFLQPVYFDRKALIAFIGNPDYDVNRFSESYGTLAKYDPNGIDMNEWQIPFGFNTNRKLVMWLGDLDKLDTTSQLLLKAYNESSDHLLTDSEFYQAQIKVVWSEPSAERQIIRDKNRFITNVKNKYDIDLLHLEEQNEKLEKKLQRPVAYSESELNEVINAFKKYLIEGISKDGLTSLYEDLYQEQNRDKNYKKLGEIKLIDKILAALLPKSYSTDDEQKLVGPLYLINDYRLILDHSMGSDEETKKNNILNTLGVATWDKQEEIYCKEIKGLKRLYQMLVAVTE